MKLNLNALLRGMPDRLRRWRGIGMRLAFGVVVFVIAFYISFPYHRVKDQVAAMAAMRDLDVEIGSAGPLLGVGIAFRDITVDTRPSDGSKPTHLKIDRARVSLSPLARLLGDEGASLSADALGGEIDVDWQASKTESRLRVTTENIAMVQIPGVKESINIPLGGKLGLSFDLTAPGKKLGQAAGLFHWTCAGCEIGDGKTKLKIAGNPLMAEGLSLPRVRLGDFSGRVVFEKGVGRLQNVQARSPDGEVSVEGEIRLAEPVQLSQVDLYLRFKLSDALLNSADKVKLMLQFIETMAKRPDGFYGVRIVGSFNHMGPPQWAKVSPFLNLAALTPARTTTSPQRPIGASTRARAAAVQAALPGTVEPLVDKNANLPRYPIEPPSSPPQETPPVPQPAPTVAAPPPPPPVPPPLPPPTPPTEAAPPAAEAGAAAAGAVPVVPAGTEEAPVAPGAPAAGEESAPAPPPPGVIE